jgi:hypothetical protein
VLPKPARNLITKQVPGETEQECAREDEKRYVNHAEIPMPKIGFSSMVTAWA